LGRREIDFGTVLSGVRLPQSRIVNPSTEHQLYLRLFVTNGAGL
jgi:hypothetical protein